MSTTPLGDEIESRQPFKILSTLSSMHNVKTMQVTQVSLFMLFLALGKAKGPVESPTVKPILNITPPPKTETLDSPESGELIFRLY